MIHRVPLIAPATRLPDGPFRPALLCAPTATFFGQNQVVAPGGGGGCGSPSVAGGLHIWFDATSLGLSNDDEVDPFPDCSGNGFDATGVAVSGKPYFRETDGPNSGPAVRLLDQSIPKGGYFSLPDCMTGLTAAHSFAVVKMDNAAGNDAPPFGEFGSDASGDLYAFSDNRIFSAFGSTARKDCGNGYTGSHNITNWTLLEFRSASGAWSCWLDGSQIFSTATNTVGWTTAPFIGHRTAGGANMRGLLAEMWIYDHVLSGGDYTTFKGGVTSKHGLTLA